MTIASSTRNPHPGGSSAGMAQPDAYAIPAISRGPLKLKTTATERAKAIHAKEARRLEKLDAKLARANGLPGSDYGGKQQTSTGENPDREAFRAESSRMARQRHSDGVYGYDPARIQSDTLCGGATGDWRMNSDGEEDFVVLGHVKPPSSRSTPSPMKRQRTSDHVNHTMRAGEHIRIIDSDDDVKVDATSDHAHIAPLPGADIEINAARLPRPRNGATNDEATIPKRHRPHRTAQARSGIDASTIPDPSAFTNGRGQLDDDAYLAAIRAGHNRTLLQREAEQRRLDQISSSHRRAEQERIAEAAREQENKKRHQRRKAEKARKAEEARRRAEEAQEKEREEGQAAVRWKEARRKVYLDKWATVYGAKSTVDGEMAGAWSFGQVPWPVYPLRTADGLSTKPVTLESLIPTGIRSFLLDMASTHGPGTATSDADSLSWKKVLTKAIQHMHPDRATTRLLPRVRSADRDAVKEGIEVCARILNALKDE